ncbi:GNAT family N-acetyltransferase [uncultured Ferrovibrio sp.]|uniref:GNAT family N-acetyltransferase n=1 Tax=uncultured Ferrovibrio sp. TaxID=1576913 RepID=UPI00261AD5AE|nr:GNAT family N-acetyltransferase [uncultured Ferrovibrio sp.]
MIVSTARLLLRPPVPGDAAVLSRLMTKEVSHRTASWPYPLSEAAAEAKLREVIAAERAHRSFARLITQREDGTPMGWLVVALVNDAPRTGSLGYWLGTAFHRQGYLSEALMPFVQAAISALQIERLEAGVQATNAASVALLKKLGMQFIGRQMHYVPAREREEAADFYAMDCHSAVNPSR